jgi:hypothetical protein
MEKRWADSMVHIVKTQYKTGDYIDEAERTASTAYAELVWAGVVILIFSFYFSSCFMLVNSFVRLTYFILLKRVIILTRQSVPLALHTLT